MKSNLNPGEILTTPPPSSEDASRWTDYGNAFDLLDIPLAILEFICNLGS